jgi:hypothetical protein
MRRRVNEPKDTSGDVVIEVCKSSLNPRVAPAAVLCRHPHDQRSDLGDDGRSSQTTPGTPIVFPGDQCLVPRQQRVRRHNRGNLTQQPSSECPGFRGQPTAPVVPEAQAPGPELFPQNAVFLLEGAMTSRCCRFIQPASATRTNFSGCDSDGRAASLSEAGFHRLLRRPI